MRPTLGLWRQHSRCLSPRTSDHPEPEKEPEGYFQSDTEQYEELVPSSSGYGWIRSPRKWVSSAKEEYERLNRVADEARLKAEHARIALEQHAAGRSPLLKTYPDSPPLQSTYELSLNLSRRGVQRYGTTSLRADLPSRFISQASANRPR